MSAAVAERALDDARLTRALRSLAPLLAEVDRLTAAVAAITAHGATMRDEIERLTDEAKRAFDAIATARAEGAREMREAAAKAADDRASGRGHTQATLFAQGQPDMAFVVGIKGGEASAVADTIRALPLPGGAQ